TISPGSASGTRAVAWKVSPAFSQASRRAASRRRRSWTGGQELFGRPGLASPDRPEDGDDVIDRCGPPGILPRPGWDRARIAWNFSTPSLGDGVVYPRLANTDAG